MLAVPLEPDDEVGDDTEIREAHRQRRAGDTPAQHEDEQHVEHDVRDRGGDQPDHHLARGALGPDQLLETERHCEHGDEREHDADVGVGGRDGGGIGTEDRHERVQQEESDRTEHGPSGCRTPDGEGRDVLDLAGPLGFVLGGAEQA